MSIHNHIQQIYSSSFVHFPGHATLSHAAATTPARAESPGVDRYRYRLPYRRPLVVPRSTVCGSGISLCATSSPAITENSAPRVRVFTGHRGVGSRRSGPPAPAPPESHRTTGTGQVQRSWTQAFRALLCTSLTVHYPAPLDATACGERAKRRMVPYPPFSAPCCAYALWTYARDVTRPLTLWSLSGGGVRMLTTFARCPTRSHLDYMSAAKPESPPPPPPP